MEIMLLHIKAQFKELLLCFSYLRRCGELYKNE